MIFSEELKLNYPSKKNEIVGLAFYADLLAPPFYC